MPEMNGEELFAQLRELGAELPIIALTGNVLPDDVERYQALGFDAVMSKPLDISGLSSAVSALFES